MKKLNPSKFLFVWTAVTLALVAGGWPQNISAQTPPATTATDTSAAPATPVVPPPNIVPGSPFAEVVRLTQAGVDQGIIGTYIINSTSPFNLDSDKIIYLTNLGAPNSVITAMMQRDQQLAAAQAAQQAQQSPPPATTAVPETAPPNTTDVTPAPAPEPAPVTVNYFYDTLAPYGTWVVINGYGRCWRPTACVYNSGWQPYCDNGHWVYTDCGWYWASTYAWGATFHYGRWFRNASFGWCWSPDTVWAPSWVTWRYSNNYCGWAPLPPGATYQAGVGFIYNGGNVSVGFSFGLGASCFTFVPTAYFCSPHPRNYCVAPAQVTQVYNNTTVINNYNINNRTIVNHGIAVENIAAATRTTIRPVPVRQMNTAYVQGGQNQSFNHSSYVSGANNSSHTRDFSSPLRTPNSSQSYSPPPQHNGAVATAPQYSEPAANYHSQSQAARTETAPVNGSSPQTTAAHWQLTGTPRNVTHYYESHPNYYRSSAGSVPQSAPTYTPSQSQPQQGGYHGGNQNWPGH